jgi:hypothetical protein
MKKEIRELLIDGWIQILHSDKIIGRGKWISKTSAKFSKDPTLCSGKYPWVAKYSWAPDEFGELAVKGTRARYILVRELSATNKATSPVSRIIYANNSDRVQDAMDAVDDE